MFKRKQGQAKELTEETTKIKLQEKRINIKGNYRIEDTKGRPVYLAMIL